jgi:hypothetical protein
MSLASELQCSSSIAFPLPTIFLTSAQTFLALEAVFHLVF